MEQKRACILMGSPRKNGNTVQLLRPVIAEWEETGIASDLIWLYDKQILPCKSCWGCQKDWSAFGCCQKDDMQEIVEAVLCSDLLVLATPIHSWYCTSSMKIVLDRLVFGMNKY